ncbi:MAG TPA: TatD family hydrolase [Candidatus Peribacteraceae bacterium]|nr:TatD family hydrolase [Candidatus Peribacteraceae bacterium]
MIDSHCHLADKKFEADLPDVLLRAKEAGVETMISIADTLDEAERCIEIAEKYPNVYATVGVHPHNAKDWIGKDHERMMALAKSSPKVRAIGEIGLDYHYDFSPRDIQQEVFIMQLILARELKMPAVVHCREAVADVWSLVSEINPKSLVLHCCTEKWEDVERFVQKGYFLSFTGIATYPNASDIRNTIEHCPLSQLMIETDAPYLAPVPHRGKRNEPAFVREILKKVAEIKQISPAEVESVTTATAQAFFRLP